MVKNNVKYADSLYKNYIDEGYQIPSNQMFKSSDSQMFKFKTFLNSFNEDNSIVPSVFRSFWNGAKKGFIIALITQTLFRNKNEFLINKLLSGFWNKNISVKYFYQYEKNLFMPYIIGGGFVGTGFYFYNELVSHKFNLNSLTYPIIGPGLYFGTATALLLSANLFWLGFSGSIVYYWIYNSFNITERRHIITEKQVPVKTNLTEEEIKYLETREKIHYLSWKYAFIDNYRMDLEKIF